MLSLLSSITLYDVVWGTSIPVFAGIFLCLVTVFFREMIEFRRKGKTYGDFFWYLVKCPCCIPPEPDPKTERNNPDSQKEEETDKPKEQDAVGTDVTKNDENDNEAGTQLETITVSTP